MQILKKKKILRGNYLPVIKTSYKSSIIKKPYNIGMHVYIYTQTQTCTNRIILTVQKVQKHRGI